MCFKKNFYISKNRLNFVKIGSYFKYFFFAMSNQKQPVVIAGPCSAESYEQLYQIVEQLFALHIDTIRVGVWKPRSRPDSFQGIGEEALKWIQDIKKLFPVRFATEVATPEHIDKALHYGIDMVWLGARTTVNPFHVQELAEALRGVSIPVLIKNPINPDLSLWIGAIERMQKSNVGEVMAIHRGFSSFDVSKFRNIPLWQIPLELKTIFPSVPLLVDPSHISGNRAYILEITQKAFDLNYDGCMVEVHPYPSQALSDKDQQLSPEEFAHMLAQLKIRQPYSTNHVFVNQLEELRGKIDQLDREIVESIAMRMALVLEIGEYKKDNQVTVFQMERWNEIFSTRATWAEKMNLDKDFIQHIYKIIHEESIRIQTEVVSQEKKN